MLKISYAPIYKYELPEGHRFPMEKYQLIPEQLLYEGTVEEANFFAPEKLEEDVLLWTHDEGYWDKLKKQELSYKEARAIGFPMTLALVNRGLYIANGTIQCARYALDNGVAMNIAGGTHHSFSDRGEGFCVFNDIAIASNYLLKNKLANKILIVDLDVHQGNGTAKIFESDTRVFTFSMHGANNYPLRKEKSDLDIGLPDKTGDGLYLKRLKETLPYLIDLIEPDFMFYLSGVDVLETDKLGHLSLSLDGCKSRDRFVLETAKLNNLPIAISMGGGYSVRLSTIVDAHANTFRLAQYIYF